MKGIAINLLRICTIMKKSEFTDVLTWFFALVPWWKPESSVSFITRTSVKKFNFWCINEKKYSFGSSVFLPIGVYVGVTLRGSPVLSLPALLDTEAQWILISG